MFILPQLPYDYDALEPSISALTMGVHHDKHHKAYVDATNRLLEARPTEDNLETVVQAAYRNGDAKLFNQAAQAWNHGFFWCSMIPTGRPLSGALAAAIESNFGAVEQFRQKFIEVGLAQFGSGWVWVTAVGEKVAVGTTHDADTAIVHPGEPLIVCDVWEHAYYLDYKNVRQQYLETWFDHVADWDFAGRQFSARGPDEGRFRYPLQEN